MNATGPVLPVGFSDYPAPPVAAEEGDALAMGTLMNARGLMELILLNIGVGARPHHADALQDYGDGHDADGLATL
jgi:hypothetical protein